MKEVGQEEAFVAGLITEVGLPILLDLKMRRDKDVRIIELEPLEDLLQWEKDSYGVHHRQIGEAALKYWRFPDSLIQYRDDPKRSSPTTWDLLDLLPHRPDAHTELLSPVFERQEPCIAFWKACPQSSPLRY